MTAVIQYFWCRVKFSDALDTLKLQKITAFQAKAFLLTDFKWCIFEPQILGYFRRIFCQPYKWKTNEIFDIFSFFWLFGPVKTWTGCWIGQYHCGNGLVHITEIKMKVFHPNLSLFLHRHQMLLNIAQFASL